MCPTNCVRLSYFADGKCMRECPDGFYGDEDSQDCEDCHTDCRTCSGPEDSDCDSCSDGLTLENGECVPEQDTCPPQTYLTGERHIFHPLKGLFLILFIMRF